MPDDLQIAAVEALLRQAIRLAAEEGFDMGLFEKVLIAAKADSIAWRVIRGRGHDE